MPEKRTRNDPEKPDEGPDQGEAEAPYDREGFLRDLRTVSRRLDRDEERPPEPPSRS